MFGGVERMKPEYVLLGSFYGEAGMPVLIDEDTTYENKVFALGDTVPGLEMRWVKDGNHLISARTCALGVSWERLDRAGYIFGRPMRIDDKAYLCRSLQVGTTSAGRSEWTDLLETYGYLDDIWHWADAGFWGQETWEKDPDCRLYRGYCSATYIGIEKKDDGYPQVGFRPVLEPLPPSPELSKWLLGNSLRVYGPYGPAAEGELVDFDEYDLTLATSAAQPDNAWTTVSGDRLVISRESISWMQKI